MVESVMETELFCCLVK